MQKGETTGRGGNENEFVKELEKHGYEGFSDKEFSRSRPRSGLGRARRLLDFSQEVEFNLPDDPPEAAPRKEKLSYPFFRGRHFRIKKVADSKGLKRRSTIARLSVEFPLPSTCDPIERSRASETTVIR